MQQLLFEKEKTGMDPKEINRLFFVLISRLASACWEQLGKQADKPDGRDPAGAQETIGMLIMLREKTTGNLTDTEERILNDTILTLQKNYEEESGSGIP